MVRPIIRGKSYVVETGKSMKAAELALSPNDSWRKIPITLIDFKNVECGDEATRHPSDDIGGPDRDGSTSAGQFTSTRPSCRQVAAPGDCGQATRSEEHT